MALPVARRALVGQADPMAVELVALAPLLLMVAVAVAVAVAHPMSVAVVQCWW